ncbi:TetR/AcrR family transcriptional regulator [Nocardioides sp. AX2bis]|uniref:TetR/AcrR family transcriptional regulator n=1 Tax=Nocardioides sp. AX2bis TaxID=2653157 RepID=UPI0012EF663C|nr:TetR/AcrR family transcriptional regulator [Nocardioides sp. AX2bis]VXB34993.1 Transcriptional regulator, TetR family [Nocardioides sp. AX2bis]
MATRSPAHDRLLDAADDLVATRGWAATPVDVVLARAEVAPATLYAHFGSKDRLLAATLDRRLARWDEAWAAAVAAADDDRGRLLAVFDALASFGEAYGRTRWCSFLGAAAEGTTSEEAVADAVRRDSTLLRDRLVALAGPVAGEGRAEELGAHLLVVVTGCLAMRLRDPDDDQLARARATAALVVDAFTA